MVTTFRSVAFSSGAPCFARARALVVTPEQMVAVRLAGAQLPNLR